MSGMTKSNPNNLPKGILFERRQLPRPALVRGSCTHYTKTAFCHQWNPIHDCYYARIGRRHIHVFCATCRSAWVEMLKGGRD